VRSESPDERFEPASAAPFDPTAVRRGEDVRQAPEGDAPPQAEGRARLSQATAPEEVVSHPQTAEAIAQAKKGDWTLLSRIFGFEYVFRLRAAAGMKDDAVLAYLADQ
jgi:hypothetical protein